MRRNCILTGILFDTQDPEQNICPEVSKNIIHVIRQDKSLRKGVSAELLRDSEIMVEMAKGMLAVDATEVGLNHPGTIGEFFLGLRDELAGEET